MSGFEALKLRMASLDNYLHGLDRKIGAQGNKPEHPIQNSKQSGFADVFKTVSSNLIKAQQASASHNRDDLSKLPNDFNAYIDTVSKEMGVDADLVRSIIKKESRFNPNARSHVGAQGLMQLMPATARTVGVFNPLNPYQNVRGGAKYIAQMIKMFGGNIPKALAAYNAGPRNVQKYGGVPPFAETQNYVKDVMKDYLQRAGYKPIDSIG